MIINTNRKYIEALATGLTLKEGIKVVEGNAWQSDVKRKIINYKMADLLKCNPSEAKGLILHETAHIKFTQDCKPTELQKKYPKSMQNIYNTFEDIKSKRK